MVIDAPFWQQVLPRRHLVDEAVLGHQLGVALEARRGHGVLDVGRHDQRVGDLLGHLGVGRDDVAQRLLVLGGIGVGLAHCLGEPGGDGSVEVLLLDEVVGEDLAAGGDVERFADAAGDAVLLEDGLERLVVLDGVDLAGLEGGADVGERDLHEVDRLLVAAGVLDGVADDDLQRVLQRVDRHRAPAEIGEALQVAVVEHPHLRVVAVVARGRLAAAGDQLVAPTPGLQQQQ